MLIKIRLKVIATFLVGTFVFCSAFFVILYPNALALEDRNLSFPIIMYHHIMEDSSKVGDYVITPQMFENDLKYLKEKGYSTITVRDLYSLDKEQSSLKPKSIMITFDDGQESFYKYAFPLLKKYGFSAVFSVIGRYTDEYSNLENRDVRYSHTTWQEMKEMDITALVEFGNHSYDMHYNGSGGRIGVTKQKNETFEEYKFALNEDINQFEKSFEKNMGYITKIYTYPYGRFSKETEKIIKEKGYSAAFTCYEKRVVPNSSEDWLYNLGRYNRGGKIKTESFFNSISVY